MFLIMLVPLLIPLMAVIVTALIFIQWLVWSAQEEELPEPKPTVELKARKLQPVTSPRELRSVMSDN